MSELANKFGIPPSLFDVAKKTIDESTEYQNKVKAHMAKKGIKSLGDLSPEEKKKFFNDLDAAHKAKNEEVKAKGKEVEDDEEEGDDKEMRKNGKKKEIEESDLPSSKEKQKTVMVKHKTSGKELKIQASALDKYKGMGYEVMKEEVEQTDEAVVKGKGYDNPDNERKAPEGKVPMTSLHPGHNDKAARLAAVQAKGKLVKGKAQSAPQKESYELTQEDIEFINSLNERK